MAALRCKMVRDLWWVGSTPALNFPDSDINTQIDKTEGSSCASTHNCKQNDDTGLAFLRPSSQDRDVDGEWEWVCSLDNDATQPLKTWLVEQQHKRYNNIRHRKCSLMVGVYFALLLEYWYRFCPVYAGASCRTIVKRPFWAQTWPSLWPHV